ncbi:hypothetical protein QYS49_31650 [Marivirga salinae]|uniref:Uncharacterized protein n=1 Tax=Marivirga salinarum TaxID=3059078 RepID=A0AA51NB36_9BACT|nr:hypothetical protein [Marivirga sp. BDSF4-3]WMN11873.1 hypothetical protein QYS49_31650 [Marivirga sp. BDSF4-3]
MILSSLQIIVSGKFIYVKFKKKYTFLDNDYIYLNLNSFLIIPHFLKSGLSLKLTILLFLLAFAFISSVKAQDVKPIFPWSGELRAGVALPSGDLAETVNIRI